MTSAIDIKQISLFDLPILEILHAEAFPEEPWDAAALLSALKMPGAFGLIGSRKNQEIDEPLGFTFGLIIGPECELLSIGVSPRGRRQHVASQLLQSFLDQAQGSTASEVFLEVAEDNVAAQTLYRAHKFEIVGRRPNYYRRPGKTWIAALQLRRNLS